jgi:hypothetical protein
MPKILVLCGSKQENGQVVVKVFGEWKEVSKRQVFFGDNEKHTLLKGYIVKQMRRTEFFCGDTRINDSEETRYLRDMIQA